MTIFSLSITRHPRILIIIDYYCLIARVFVFLNNLTNAGIDALCEMCREVIMTARNDVACFVVIITRYYYYNNARVYIIRWYWAFFFSKPIWWMTLTDKKKKNTFFQKLVLTLMKRFKRKCFFLIEYNLL